MNLEAILAVIQAALNTAVPLLPAGTAQADAVIAESLAAIIQSAHQAYQVHVGEPYDLSLLENEDPVA